ncbi:MAG: CPBP family intramembrane metalloprotease [Firmicutes bacterium]|nr:CPBP family intramembrane metalloprotease [Bacillota bacterium]
MKFDLLKGIKIRYLFIKMFSISFLGIIILILYAKGFGRTLTSADVEIIAFIIVSLWFLLLLTFLRKYKINISNFIMKPLKKRFIFEVPVFLLLTYLGGIGIILVILFIVYHINPHVLEITNSCLREEPIKYNSTFITSISFIGGVLVGPITEEFIFRGVLLNRLYSKYGISKSIIYSSLLFFIMHLKPNPILLFLGISSCILVYKYKSLIPSMLLHVINNFIVFMRDLDISNRQTPSNDLNIDFSTLLTGSILFGIYIFYIYKNYPKHQSLNLSDIKDNQL